MKYFTDEVMGSSHKNTEYSDCFLPHSSMMKTVMWERKTRLHFLSWLSTEAFGVGKSVLQHAQ